MSVAVLIKARLSDYSRVFATDARHKTATLQSWGTPMLRLAIAIAVAAPLLSGCIVISTEKPTTRVVTAPAAQ
ncbi:hypothetical protein [uncultured Brevundimonas sp.]|uniref:hypothetical protein n=1 Tax=uncultured Brevundimonas sp. TaxID=213418 RepID=UPI0025DFF509|nr:hypothetical protein [uncultured Brevundimonas sp.]